MMDPAVFFHLAAPIKRGLQNMIARGRVTGVVQKKAQHIQAALLAGEVKDGVEHIEPYGFTSHPLAGAETVMLFLGGDRTHGVSVVVGDRRYRIASLQPGEVAIYTDEDQGGGHRIVLKRDRRVEIVADRVEIKADQEIVLDVGAGANRLQMTPEGTDWRMQDYEAHQ